MPKFIQKFCIDTSVYFTKITRCLQDFDRKKDRYKKFMSTIFNLLAAKDENGNRVPVYDHHIEEEVNRTVDLEREFLEVRNIVISIILTMSIFWREVLMIDHSVSSLQPHCFSLGET